MLILHIECTNSIKVIDTSSAISSVFGSRYATFYIGNGEKVSILFKAGSFEYWKLKIHNKKGFGGNKFLRVNRLFGENPTLSWVGGRPPLIIKFRPSFFGL